MSTANHDNGQTALGPLRIRGRRPRILYLITRAERGGAQTHVLGLADAMRQEFDVAVATGEEGFLTQSCRQRNIPVHIIPHLQRQVNPLADVRAFAEVYQVIRQVQPDLVHAHTFKAGFLGRLAGQLVYVPTIYTVHMWLFAADPAPMSWRMVGPFFERLAARRCDRIITVAQAGARLAGDYGVCPAEKVLTIHNGILDLPQPAASQSRSAVVITMVARFTEPKDHDVLIRAFAALPQTSRLCLVGDGPLRPKAQQLAWELGVRDRTDFLGDRDDVPQILASTDVFVLASRSEMLPISILEAMRAKLPVVASNVGGVSEAVLDGVTGLLVPSGSAVHMAQALARLVEQPALRRDLGRAGRQRFHTHFLASYMEQRTRQAYVDTLRQRGLLTVSAPETGAINALGAVQPIES